MSQLSVFTAIPRHLATRTGLKRDGLVATADPVALYNFRCPAGGWRRVPLYHRDQTRDATAPACKRRLAAIHGQSLLL